MIAFAALCLFAAPAAAPTSATLILYRDHAEPLMFKPVVSVDGVEMARLGQNRFLVIDLSAGRHRIDAHWPAIAGHRPASLIVTVQSGAVSYVELTGTAAFWRTRAATALIERPGEDGQEQVTACCKQAR